MVLRHKEHKMSSEQPVKKKLKRTDEEEPAVDEPDYIRNLTENGMSALHLSLPPNVNETDLVLNSLNAQLHGVIGDNHKKNCFRTNNQQEEGSGENGESTENISIEPAPNICLNLSTSSNVDLPHTLTTNNSILSDSLSFNASSLTVNRITTNHDRLSELEGFQSALIRQCLCNISDNLLQTGRFLDLNGVMSLLEWPTSHLLQLLSSVQLLFDVYLKQNNTGCVCSRIADICRDLIHSGHDLIEHLLSFVSARNRYLNYLLARIISSFLIIAKSNVREEWLESLANYLTLEQVDHDKMNFSLEVVKRVVEWKDVEIHVLEETSTSARAGGNTSQSTDSFLAWDCVTVRFTDSESFDTSAIKGVLIRCLESKWPHLITHIQGLMEVNDSVESQTCVLTFLSLWESTISVKANLSVVDTKPFYAHLENFASLMLNVNPLPPIVWKQLLSLFNEILCYGSTLALQDMLPDDTCKLAYVIVRYVKDSRLLERLPYRCGDGYFVHGFVGTIPSGRTSQTRMDRTLLQKMVLLVLKSVSVTVKETRTDSSDSSVGSDDYDYYQDMQLIERSIRDVLKKVDVFVKASLDFHPETQFSKLLINLFSDQDDYMIESMVCTLDITVGISYRNAVFPDLVSMLDPVLAFVEFLNVVSHDSDVLLDYLVSNETCFLLYLLRFLKYIRRNWSKFVSSCQSAGSNELGNTMTVLIRLNMQINRLVSKHLFPYNITPVSRLLEVCENLYESNGSS